MVDPTTGTTPSGNLGSAHLSNATTCFADLTVALDPDKNPRVIAYRDKESDNTLVLEDKVTGTTAKLTFNPGFDDQETFSKIDRIWDLLLNAPGDMAVMVSRFKQIAAVEGCTTEVNLGQTNPVLGQVAALMQELPALAQKSSAKGEFVTPTIDELIRGKETYLIDMAANPAGLPPVTGTAVSRDSTQWDKLKVSVEDGEVLLTLQSSGRPKPTKLEIDGPTSITFSLGRADELIGEQLAKKLRPILKTFVETENASTSLFGKESATIQALLGDSTLKIKSIQNAKIEGVDWINVGLADKAKLTNVEFSGNSIVSLVGSPECKGVVVASTVALTLDSPDITFEDCVITPKALAGDVSRMKAIRTRMRGDFTANMKDAEFIGPEYQGMDIHSWLGNMHFSAVCGPVQLLVLEKGCRRLSQEEERAYKMATHSGPPFENQGLIDAIYASPNLGVSRPAISDRFEKQSFTGDDMEQWGPGRYVTICGDHKRRALLCIDDDDSTTSPGGRTFQQLRQAHLLLELADGKYEKFSTNFHNEIIPYLMGFLNNKQLKPNDPPGGICKVNGVGEQGELDLEGNAATRQD